MGHLSQLMDYESGYIEDLKRYIYNAQRELDFLRNTLDEIENERKLESEKEKTNHLKYPLNQFRLIRRFEYDWPDVNKVIGRIKSLQVRTYDRVTCQGVTCQGVRISDAGKSNSSLWKILIRMNSKNIANRSKGQIYSEIFIWKEFFVVTSNLFPIGYHEKTECVFEFTIWIQKLFCPLRSKHGSKINRIHGL